MKHIKEIRLLVGHVLSANRLAKLKIIIKEWVMGLRFHTATPAKCDRKFPSDPPHDVWRCHEVRSIELDFFKRGSVAVVEDEIHEDGYIHAQHEHIVQKLYGASSYTNQSTHRSVFAQDDKPINHLSSIRALRKERAPKHKKIAVTKFVEGTTANLYGPLASSEGNYCHWFVDALSRLFMIEKFHSLDSIDFVLVPPLKYDFQWDSLAAFGFERSQIIELNALECLQFECMLASSSPRGAGSAICPSWLIVRYRETLLEMIKDVPSVGGKLVYVSRRDAPNRMFLNENEVCAFLEQRGFSIVELTPLNLWQKIAVFRDADIIVSQTGAGLTNLMFTHENVKVLELVDERFVYPLYASLAVYGGGSHHAHYFSNDSALGRVNAMVAKSSIDLAKLEKSLESIGS